MTKTEANLARAGVLCIGTELTRGEIHNTNATWLCDKLTDLGLEVVAVDVVADDPSAMVMAFERLASSCSIVVSTGGLGPTTDDLTSQTVASWLSEPLIRNSTVVAHLEARLARLGRPLKGSNLSQADFPQSASVVANPHGSAPGFRVERGGCALYFMPGVPREMRPMFEAAVRPEVESRVRGAHRQVRLHCFGLGESEINDRLQGLDERHAVVVGYRAHFPEVEVKLLASGATRQAAQATAERAAAEARDLIGAAVYAEGDSDLPGVVEALCRAKGHRLCLAESCTGGYLANLLCSRPASDYFVGAIVAYANRIKEQLLGVPASLITQHGAVSHAVAAAMAEGARRATGADTALSITGIAGPDGGTETKPVGLVYVGLAEARTTLTRELRLVGYDRGRFQQLSSWCALQLLRQHWLSLGPLPLVGG